MKKPTMLIISFSDIKNDARVKKQINLFADKFDVTTCGRGEALRDDVEHLEIEYKVSKIREVLRAIFLRMHLYRLAFATEKEKRDAITALRGRHFDLAISNDAESIAVAGKYAGFKKTLADLHEYWPGVHDQYPAWVKIRKPYYEWMMRKHAKKAGAVTTVSKTIAERYRKEFGFECEVVHNATPKHDLAPSTPSLPLRIVHAGAAHPDRNIDVMMRAVAKTKTDVILDLYLTQEKTNYAQKLRDLAKELGDRITIRPPVPQNDLIHTLNQYDVGIHILPQNNTNNSLALPNKFFDYIQARLAIVVGPTQDMVSRLREFDLGVETTGFEETAVIDALDNLTVKKVTYWKEQSDKAASVLNSENELPVWAKAIGSLI